MPACLGLKGWVAAARAEDLPGLRAFATGSENGSDAVVQGLTAC
ncbi:hypothetical protein [Streptomyces sp. cf386]|nr:hypothetical protein [Streptomyces sp. cf386]